MYLGGKCKISLSNDDLERFLRVRALCALPMNLSGPRGSWQIGIILPNNLGIHESLYFPATQGKNNPSKKGCKNASIFLTPNCAFLTFLQGF